MARARRLLGFLGAGALGAATNVAAAWLLVGAGLHYLAASVLGFLAGFAAHFLAQRRVYGARYTGRRQMAAFALLAVGNVSFGALAAFAGVEALRLPPALAQAGAVCLLAIFNYWAYPRLVFLRDASGNPAAAHLLPCLAFALATLWGLAHVPALRYGTESLPLHQSYVGDEQSPVNGALHILKDRSLLAVRNLPTLYYGPLFAVVALPAVVADFASGCWSGLGCSAASYQARILYDWGGIVRAARLLALLASLFGLAAIFAAFRSLAANPRRAAWLPYLATGLVATNFYYFEYASFFKHWPFVVTLALVDLWAALGVAGEESPRIRRRYWIAGAAAAAASFGISFLSAAYRVVYLPLALSWLARRDWARLRELVRWGLGYLLLCALVVAWHPYALARLLAGGAFVSAPGDEGATGGFAFYARLLLENHAGLLLAGMIAASVVGWRLLARDRVAWTLALPAALNLAIFLAQGRHEGRYALPTAVFSLLLLAYVVALAAPKLVGRRLARAGVVAGLAVAALYHLAAMAAWSAAISSGPAEARFVRELDVALPSLPASTTVLALQDYLVGTAHTPAGYRSYLAAAKAGQDINLYDALLATPAPAGERAVDFRYAPVADVPGGVTRKQLLLGDFSNVRFADYGLVFWRIRPRLEINQFDYFDESLARVFFHEDSLDRYVLLGGASAASARTRGYFTDPV